MKLCIPDGQSSQKSRNTPMTYYTDSEVLAKDDTIVSNLSANVVTLTCSSTHHQEILVATLYYSKADNLIKKCRYKNVRVTLYYMQ